MTAARRLWSGMGEWLSHKASRVGPVAIGAAALALVGGSIVARSDFESCRSACRSSCGARRVAPAAPLAEDPATGRVLIDLRDETGAAGRARIASELARAIAPYPWAAGSTGELLSDEAELWRVSPPASELEDVLAALSDEGVIEALEIERRWSIPGEIEGEGAALAEAATRDREPCFAPNDPYYRFQWHLDQIGMPEAWAMSRGRGVVVAVIDTGVAHRSDGRFAQAPDFARTRFVPGWDFVDGDAQPDDEHGHGTHVAGTIAQSTNNELGVAGVAPEAAIMPLRVLDASGGGSWGEIAAAIRWAADHGAHVINMSLGGGVRSRTVERAIDHAHRQGVVIVAAAGNASRSTVEYPARHEHVIAVGAVRFDRTLSFYSSYGNGLDIVAPGGDLRVDQNNDGRPDGVLQNAIVGRDLRRFDYVAYQGTSMASPHVAGAAALVVSSGVTDPDAVERLLERSAIDLHDRQRYAAGLLQAQAALRASSQELGGLRGGLALLLGAGVLFGLRGRRRLGVALGPTLMAAVLFAGGLGALPWQWLPGTGEVGLWMAAGGPGAGAELGHELAGRLGGSWAALFALSALVPLVAVVVMLHLRRIQPVLVGLCLGTAAFLLLEAVWPTMTLALLPRLAVGPWLLANAALAALLGRQVARLREPVQ